MSTRALRINRTLTTNALRIASLLVMALMLLLPATAWAEERLVADAAAFKTALKESGSGDVIVLSNDIAIAEAGSAYDWTAWRVEDDVTIDLKGKTLTLGGDTRFIKEGPGLLTIQNGTLLGSGRQDNRFIEFKNGSLSLKEVTVKEFNGDSETAPVAMIGTATALSVDRCTFTNNACNDAGAIYSSVGAVSVTNSTFSNNRGGSGAIWSSGESLEVQDSVFSENTSTGNGGAIYGWNCDANATRVTFEKNAAGPQGGAIYVSANDGAEHTQTLTNCTIERNSSNEQGGGIYIATNGGKQTVTIDGGSVTNNVAGNHGGGIGVVGVALTLKGAATVSNNAATNHHGGGLRAESSQVTIEQGVNITSNSAGQQGGGMRIEGESSSLIVAGVVTNNTSGEGGGGISAENVSTTLQSGLVVSDNEAKTMHGGGIVVVGSKGSLTISDGATITNNTAALNGGGIYADGVAAVTVNGGVISENTARGVKGDDGGMGGGQGGGLWAWNTDVTMNAGTITNNSATTKGGGIFCGVNDGESHPEGHDTRILGGMISQNKATGYQNKDGVTVDGNGGGIATIEAVRLTVTKAIISDNTAGGEGGGINADGQSELTIDPASQGDVTITGNHANNDGWAAGGGGIAVRGKSLTLNNATISDNVSAGSGGGILFAGKTFTMNSGIVSNNKAVLHEGGGITIAGGMAQILHGSVTGNTTGWNEDGSPAKSPEGDGYADWGGGGIFVSDKAGLLVMPNPTQVTNNEAGGFGGGVAACSTGRTFVLDTIAIYGNDAQGQHLSGAGSAKNDDHTYAADNPVFMGNGYQDLYSALSAYVTNGMPGGTEGWQGSKDGEKYDGVTYPIISSSALGLTANGEPASGTAFDVVITDNKSYTHGGGILNNGTVIFGNTEQIEIGRPVIINANKWLTDGDNHDLRSLLIGEDANDEGQPGRKDLVAFQISGVDGEVFSTGKLKDNYDIVFDRRLTFDGDNCDGEGPWSFDYIVKEVETEDTPNWMSISPVEYKMHIVVEKRLSQTYAYPTADVSDATTYHVYNYVITDETVVQRRADASSEWEDFSAAIDRKVSDDGIIDNSHAATIGLWSDDNEWKSFVNTVTDVSFSVAKVWDDDNDRDGLRPQEITMELYANGEYVQDFTVSAPNWNCTLEGLPRYEVDGETVSELVYTAAEKDEVNGYVASYGTDSEGNPLVVATHEGVVTNTHETEKTTFKVTKVWADDNNRDGIRPASTEVTLCIGNEPVRQAGITASQVLTAEGGWTYTWTGLNKYDAGQPIEYSVRETTTDVITGTDGAMTYAMGVARNGDNGCTVTNTHTPEKTIVIISKVWDDADDQDGKRPDMVLLQLYANGVPVGDPQRVPGRGGASTWSHTFTGLPKKEDGEEIRYTVDEVDESGKTAVPENYRKTVRGLTVTNAHTPETVRVSGKKTWNDNNNQDGIRPSAILITLTGVVTNDDGSTTTVSTDARNVTTDAWEWKDLPKYNAGREIVYTLNEATTSVISGVDGPGTYASVVDGYDVTNTHTPEKVGLAGAKTWNDNDNRDGKRPNSITVRLLANGSEVDSKTVTEEDDWKWDFGVWPKYAEGELVVYTIAEDAVSDYTAAVNGMYVTNTHDAETVDVRVDKVWDDADDQDGKRPDEVSLALYADGTFVQAFSVYADDDWTCTLRGLAKYSAGKEIVYTVAEDDGNEKSTVPQGYEVAGIEGSMADGFTVTNVHAPEMIDIDATKTWDDTDDQDGIRPTSVEFVLLANGTEVRRATLTAADEWKASFTNLPKYADGALVNYTLTETATDTITDTDGPSTYASTVTGSADEGFTVTNAHTPHTKSGRSGQYIVPRGSTTPSTEDPKSDDFTAPNVSEPSNSTNEQTETRSQTLSTYTSPSSSPSPSSTYTKLPSTGDASVAWQTVALIGAVLVTMAHWGLFRIGHICGVFGTGPNTPGPMPPTIRRESAWRGSVGRKSVSRGRIR